MVYIIDLPVELVDIYRNAEHPVERCGIIYLPVAIYRVIPNKP